MCRHDQDEDQRLSNHHNFTTDPTEQEFTGVRKVVDLRIAHLELEVDIAGVRRNESQTDN